MLTIHDVFHWFLEKEAMSFKKANFLCYYAQAWYVTLYDKGPFFKEGFQAWVHGPVSPDLFHEYKGNGYRLPILKEDTGPFSESELKVLELVYSTYGPLSPGQLEWNVHREDPWIRARKGAGPLEPSSEAISVDSMREYYRNHYRAADDD